MVATATANEDKVFTYNSSEYQTFLENLTGDFDSGGLLTFIGPYMPHKTKAIKAIAQKLDKQVTQQSLKDIVHKSTEQTRINIDDAFKGVDADNEILLFINGANLCGNYMGNTFSKVKYATPEERHFLNHVDQFNGLTIVTVRSDDAADETIKRKSRAIIQFPLPDSFLRRASWKLKNYTFHGFKMPDERIEIT